MIGSLESWYSQIFIWANSFLPPISFLYGENCRLIKSLVCSKQNCPVTAIHLSNNKFLSMEGFEKLLIQAPPLKVLNLGRNKAVTNNNNTLSTILKYFVCMNKFMRTDVCLLIYFKNIQDLDNLRGLQISELKLKDNPLCQMYLDLDL